MRRAQLARIRAAFVYNAHVDIKLLILEKLLGHLRETRWTIRVDLRGQTRDPRVIDQRSKLEIVIRVVMRDKDVAQPVERDTRSDQLLRHTVTAVDQVRNVVDQERRRGIAAACCSDARPAFGAQQYDGRRFVLLAESAAC